MAKFKIGDRVSWSEFIDNNDADDPNRYRAVTRTGIVREVLDSAEVYRQPPHYKPTFRGERKESKFPAGTVVCRVEADGEATPKGRVSLRNVHEGQLSSATS